jgi:predicted amidohydrolase YtcJ
VNHRVAIREAEVAGAVVDVVIEHGRVSAIIPPRRSPADHVIDAGGAALLPGLHDHHVHLLAVAAAASSIACGPPEVTGPQALVQALRAADATQPTGQWLRGVGYHDSVSGDLDRARLDSIVADRPCRVQHRSGHAWVFNSAALAAAGLTGDGDRPPGVETDASGVPTGRIYGLDAWLRDRLPPSSPDLAAVGRRLAGYGVTAVTDATPVTAADDLAPLATAVRRRELGQRIVVTGSPALPLDAFDGVEPGPAKVVLADHRLPGLDQLVDDFGQARANGRRIAVHCVTRAALMLALAAWDEVGAVPGDRIEHGAVVPDEVVGRIRRLGLTVVTQPGFVALRGDDYVAEVEPDDQPYLWRTASLLAAGIPVGFSTDAPFGDADPWRAIDAAVHRRTVGGRVLGARERLPARVALERFLAPLDDPGAPARRIAVGEPADLCLLGVPLAIALADPTSRQVRLALRDGNVLSR